MISPSFLMPFLILTSQPALSQPTDTPAVMMLAEVDDEETVKPKPKPKPKKPKPVAQTPAMPSAPIPYVQTSGATPEKAPPAPVSVAPLPPVSTSHMPAEAPLATLSAPASDAQPQRLPDPPPPPERVYVYPLADTANSRETSLRCETLVYAANGTSTRGVVHLSLIPSLVNPDEFADLHVMAVDIGHASIIRNTVCEAYRCSVAVTPTFYSLTVVDKRKSEIKITLNRQTGAFYGYEKQPETMASGLITLKKGVVTNENGWCVPEARGKTLF